VQTAAFWVTPNNMARHHGMPTLASVSRLLCSSADQNTLRCSMHLFLPMNKPSLFTITNAVGTHAFSWVHPAHKLLAACLRGSEDGPCRTRSLLQQTRRGTSKCPHERKGDLHIDNDLVVCRGHRLKSKWMTVVVKACRRVCPEHARKAQRHAVSVHAQIAWQVALALKRPNPFHRSGLLQTPTPGTDSC